MGKPARVTKEQVQDAGGPEYEKEGHGNINSELSLVPGPEPGEHCEAATDQAVHRSYPWPGFREEHLPAGQGPVPGHN